MTAAPYKTVDELIRALMKVPAAKRHQFTFSCRLPESTHGGLANSVWAKHLSPTISTQTSAASPPHVRQSEQANTAKPDIQTSKGPGLKPTVAKAKTKKPQATAPVAVAVQDLPSLGNPPAHPVDCDSYEVKLPREVRVANRVEPYIGTLNKILGIILQVVKKQNAVQIKTHQARSNRGLSKELIDFDNEYKARRAYDIFLRWAADMYRGGEPKDLLRFVAEAMGSEADEMRDRCKEVARFIDQKMNLQCQGAAPAENPENSHLPTLKRGDAMSKHNGHLELMPETRRIQINNLRTSPSVQVKWEHQDVSSALIDEPRHNSPESRDELEQRVNDMWELATYDEDLEFLGDMRGCRDGFEELGSQMLRGQIHMPYFFERIHATFFSSHYSTEDFGEKFEVTIRIVQNLLSLVLEQTNADQTEARIQIASLTRSLRFDARRHRLTIQRRKINETSRFLGRTVEPSPQPWKRQRNHSMLDADDNQQGKRQALPRMDETSRVLGPEIEPSPQPQERRKDHNMPDAANNQEERRQALPISTEPLGHVKVKVEEDDETATGVPLDAHPRQGSQEATGDIRQWLTGGGVVGDAQSINRPPQALEESSAQA